MNQQQFLHVQPPVDQVKEMERLIAAANCVRYFEIEKETQHISKIQFGIPKLSKRKSIFELSFNVFLVFLFFYFSPRRTEKISETRDVNHLSL